MGKHRKRGVTHDIARGGPASSSTIEESMEVLALEQTAAWKSTYRDMLVMREAAWGRVMDHIGVVRRGGRSRHSGDSSRSEMSETSVREDGVESGKEEIPLGNEHEPGTSAGGGGTKQGAMTTAERVEEVRKYQTQIQEFAVTCPELIDLERSIRFALGEDAPLTDEAQRMKARLKSERLVYDTIAARFLEDQNGNEIEDPDEEKSSKLPTALTELAEFNASSKWRAEPDLAGTISNLVDELLEEQTYLHEELNERSKRLGVFGCAGDVVGIHDAVSLAQAYQVADRWVESIPDAVERFWSDYALAQRQSMESFKYSIAELKTAAIDENVEAALDSFVALTQQMTDSHRFAVVGLADARRRLSTKSEDQAILSQLHNDALASSRAIEQRLLVDVADLRAKSALTTLPMARGEETTARAILTYLSSFESAPDTATA